MEVFDSNKPEGIEKYGSVEYTRALIKSQRNVIKALMDEIELYKDEVKYLRISLGMLDTVCIKAEEVRMKRDKGISRD